MALHKMRLMMRSMCGCSSRRYSNQKVASAGGNWNVVQVFDRAAKMKQRTRARDVIAPPLCDYIREEVGYRLADRVFDIKKTFKDAADIGCFRGHVSKHLTPDCIENLTMYDMIQDHLDEAATPEGINVNKLIMDEEHINLAPNSFDLILSSLCLHWVNDLPGCFENIIKGLRNDGVFLGTIFGEDTLYELRSSLQLADLERNGGIAPHVSPFTRIRDIGGLLNRAGFTLQTIDVDEIVVGYPSMFELMWDLKGMGESNAAFNRQLRLSRDTQIAAASIYKELYGKLNDKTNDITIPATFQIIFLLGWKPDPTQPKPLERGTAQVSLKDINKLEELAKTKGDINIDEK